MDFSQVIANDKAKNDLINFVKNDRMPHALLLTGPEGSGKLALALAYAAYIMCENKQEDGSCSVCRACKKTYQFIHPDVHYSFPFIGANNTSDEFIKEYRSFLGSSPYGGIEKWLQSLGADNKQVNINTKECRSIIRKLTLQSFEGDSKVLIMWLPEYLRKEGNRLLKMIEEPTDNTYFILISDKVDLILPTIISRTQLVKVSPLHDEQLADKLIEHYHINQENARHIAFMSEGNLVKALEFSTQNASNLSTEILDWFRICYSLKSDVVVNWVDKFSKKTKEEQKSFLQYALNFFREIARVNILEENKLRLKENELQTAKKIAGIVNFEQIDELNKVLNDTIYFIERNANIKILMMDTSISFRNVLRQGVLAAR